MAEFDSNQSSSLGVGRPAVDRDLRRLDVVLLVLDVVDSTRLTEADEDTHVRRIHALLSDIAAHAATHHAGALLERRGDGLLLRLGHPFEALELAHYAHAAALQASLQCRPGTELALRAGVHASAILTDEMSFFGHGISMTFRLAAMAQPGETWLSAAARDLAVDGLRHRLIDLGEQHIKHGIAPLRAFRAIADGPVRLQPPPGPDRPNDPAALSRPSLAVLPFMVPDAVPHAAALGDLIAESIIAQLSGAEHLSVVSRLSSASLARVQMSAEDKARQLGARYLVSGTVQVMGERLLVYLEVIDVGQDRVIHAERFAGSLSDLLQANSELAAELSLTVSRQVMHDQLVLLARQPLPQLDSHALYLWGLNLMHRLSPQDFGHARQVFEHLKERHPRSAVPSIWLGKWHMLRVVQGWSEQTELDIRLAASEAERAESLEPNHAMAATIQGMIAGYLRHDPDAARQCLDRALAVSPSESMAHLQRAQLAGWVGDAARVPHHLDQALRLAPLDPHRYYLQALAAGALLGSGDLDNALRHVDASIQANRLHVANYKVKAMVTGLRGDLEEARQAVQQARALAPDFTLQQFEQVSPWVMHPRFADFRQVLAEAGVPAH